MGQKLFRSESQLKSFLLIGGDLNAVARLRDRLSADASPQNLLEKQAHIHLTTILNVTDLYLRHALDRPYYTRDTGTSAARLDQFLGNTTMKNASKAQGVMRQPPTPLDDSDHLPVIQVFETFLLDGKVPKPTSKRTPRATQFDTPPGTRTLQKQRQRTQTQWTAQTGTIAPNQLYDKHNHSNAKRNGIPPEIDPTEYADKDSRWLTTKQWATFQTSLATSYDPTAFSSIPELIELHPPEAAEDIAAELTELQRKPQKSFNRFITQHDLKERLNHIQNDTASEQYYHAATSTERINALDKSIHDTVTKAIKTVWRERTGKQANKGDFTHINLRRIRKALTTEEHLHKQAEKTQHPTHRKHLYTAQLQVDTLITTFLTPTLGTTMGEYAPTHIAKQLNHDSAKLRRTHLSSYLNAEQTHLLDLHTLTEQIRTEWNDKDNEQLDVRISETHSTLAAWICTNNTLKLKPHIKLPPRHLQRSTHTKYGETFYTTVQPEKNASPAHTKKWREQCRKTKLPSTSSPHQQI